MEMLNHWERVGRVRLAYPTCVSFLPCWPHVRGCEDVRPKPKQGVGAEVVVLSSSAAASALPTSLVGADFPSSTGLLRVYRSSSVENFGGFRVQGFVVRT